MAVTTVDIIDVGEENVELKNDFEYYKRCIQVVTKHNEELRKELDSAYEYIRLLELNREAGENSKK